MSTPRSYFEHGAHSVLKGRILPQHREHGGKNACSKWALGGALPLLLFLLFFA